MKLAYGELITAPAVIPWPGREPSVLVDTEGLDEKTWLEFRRKGIGGSDAAAVMGLSPFCTLRDLYNDKLGLVPMEEEENGNWVQLEVGHRLEELVAKLFAQKTGLKVFPIRKMFYHPDYPFMLADVDFFALLPDGELAIVECKTTNYNNRDKWADGAVPVNYELQVRHYMKVCGIHKAFICCLYGNSGNDFVWQEIEWDPDTEADLVAQEGYVWNHYILAGVEPPYTEKSELVLRSIRRWYGAGDPSLPQVTLDPGLAANLKRYAELKAEKSRLESEAKKLDEQMKAQCTPILEEMGRSCTAVCQVPLTQGVPDVLSCSSLDNGIIHLYNKVINQIDAELDLPYKEQAIDLMIQQKTAHLDPEAVKIASRLTEEFVADMLDKLRELDVLNKSTKAVFAGGGSLRLRRYIEQSELVREPLFIEDICANAKGYALLYQQSGN